jgi:hypothetical protein
MSCGHVDSWQLTYLSSLPTFHAGPREQQQQEKKTLIET